MTAVIALGVYHNWKEIPKARKITLFDQGQFGHLIEV